VSVTIVLIAFGQARRCDRPFPVWQTDRQVDASQQHITLCITSCRSKLNCCKTMSKIIPKVT